VQLEDIMKFQKMEIISVGTDFDIIRFVLPSPFFDPSVVKRPIGKRFAQDISIKQLE
jgi:pre-mRNA-splicing factor ATP-dependent RNA helicase DHX38/PRP16